jgi:2-dehydropantoate 2-reductase
VSRIAVLGPGGVGGFISATLSRAGEPVVVVARDATVRVIADRGIAVQSVRLGDFTARPDAVAALNDGVDVLLVTTKANALPAALQRIHTPPRLVVPLLNGLEHMDRLRQRFGPGVVAAGVIRIESDRPAPGRVLQTSPSFRVDLAADDPALALPLERLAATLERAGLPTRIGPSEAQILWSKLVRLNALALTTSAADRPIGFIRSDPDWRSTLELCIAESAAVANADGAPIDPAQPLGELLQAHSELGSSMQRDLAAGREPELDAIAGAVLRAGARHGLTCPTVERLSLLVAARYSGGRTGGADPGA